MTVEQLWWITLAIYAVVLLVVAALLMLILVEARKIHAGVSAIWTVGQKIANNTIHISLLERTNQLAGQILASARGIVGATAQIGAHAASCPGCPQCVLGRAR